MAQASNVVDVVGADSSAQHKSSLIRAKVQFAVAVEPAYHDCKREHQMFALPMSNPRPAGAQPSAHITPHFARGLDSSP
jgi:hypothetical protein